MRTSYRCTLGFLGISVAGVAWAQTAVPVAAVAPPPSFFRTLGVPAGSQSFTTTHSVTSDGVFVFGNDFSTLLGAEGFVAFAESGPRFRLGPLPGTIFGLGNSGANDSLTAVFGVGQSSTLSEIGGARLSAAPWFVTNGIFSPGITDWVPTNINADGTLIAGKGVTGPGLSPTSFVLDNGVLIDVQAALSGIGAASDAVVTDVGAYRRVSVGTALDNGNVQRAFWLDHRTGQARFVGQPPSFPPTVIALFARVSADGLTVGVSGIDTATGTFFAWIEFDNGVTRGVAPWGPPGAATLTFIAGLSDTGQTIVGNSDFGGVFGEAVVTQLNTMTTLQSELAAAGLAISPLVNLGAVTDISARDHVVVGSGLQAGPVALTESYALRLPFFRMRSDFNRDGVFPDQQDILDFQAAQAAGNLSADWNYDGLVQPLDFTLFFNDWNNGL